MSNAGRKPSLSPEQVLRARTMRAQGKTIREIAETLGRGRDAVHRAIGTRNGTARLSGEQLYGQWAGAMKAEWPRSAVGYSAIFSDSPAVPRAWAFLSPVEQRAWERLAGDVT